MQDKDLLKAFDGIAGEVELKAVKELLEQNDDSKTRAAIVVEVRSVDISNNQVVSININEGEHIIIGKTAVDLALEINNLRSDVRFKVLNAMSNHFISIVNCTGPYRTGAKVLLDTLAMCSEGLTLTLVTKIIVAATRLKITSNYIKLLIQYYQDEDIVNKKPESTVSTTLDGSAILDFIGINNNTKSEDIKSAVGEAMGIFGNTISITDLSHAMRSPLENVVDEPKRTSMYEHPIDAEQFKRDNALSYSYGWGGITPINDSVNFPKHPMDHIGNGFRPGFNGNRPDSSHMFSRPLFKNTMGCKVLEKCDPLMLSSISGRDRNHLVKEFASVNRKVIVIDDRNVDAITPVVLPQQVLGITNDTINNAYVRVRGNNVYLEMDGYSRSILSIDISLDNLYKMFINSGSCGPVIYSKIVRFLITTYANLSSIYLSNVCEVPVVVQSLQKAREVLGEVILSNSLLLTHEDRTNATNWLFSHVNPEDKVFKCLTINGYSLSQTQRSFAPIVNNGPYYNQPTQASVDEYKPNGKPTPIEELVNTMTRLHWAMNKHFGNLNRVLGEDVCLDVDFINELANDKDIDFRIIGVGRANIKDVCKHMGANMVNIYEVPEGFNLDGFFFVGQNLFASYVNKNENDVFKYVDITATEFNLNDRRTVDVRSDSSILKMYTEIANKLSKACHDMVVRRVKIDLSIPLLVIYQLMDTMDPEVLTSLTGLLSSVEQQGDDVITCYKTPGDFKDKALKSIVENTPIKEVVYDPDNVTLKEITDSNKGFKNLTPTVGDEDVNRKTIYRKDVTFQLSFIPHDLKLAIVDDELFATSDSLDNDWVWVPDPLDFNQAKEESLGGNDLTKLCITICNGLGRLGCRGPKTENRLLTFVVENVDKLGMDNLRIFHDKITSDAYPDLNPELVNVISDALSVRHMSKLVDLYESGMEGGGFYSSSVYKNIACKEVLFTFSSYSHTSYTINANHMALLLGVLKSDKLLYPKYHTAINGLRGLLGDEIVKAILNSKKVNNKADFDFLLLHLFNVVKELPLENIKALIGEYKCIPALTLSLHGVEFRAGNIIRSLEELVESLEILENVELYSCVNDLLPMSDEPKEDGEFDITMDISEFVVFTINNKYKLAIEDNVKDTLVINDVCNARVLRHLMHRYITAMSEMDYYGAKWTEITRALRPKFLIDNIKHIAMVDIIAMLNILSSNKRLKSTFIELYNVMKERYFSLVDTIESSTLSKQPTQVNIIPLDTTIVAMHETEKYLSICFKDKDENHYNINLVNGKYFEKKGVNNQKVASEIVAYILSNYGSKILEGKNKYPMMCGMLYRFKDTFYRMYPESTLFHILDSVGDIVDITTDEAKRFIGMLDVYHVAPDGMTEPINANYELCITYKLHRNFRIRIKLPTIDVVKKIFYTKSRITLLETFINDILTESIPDTYTYKRLAVLIVGCMWDKNISIDGFTPDMLDILLDHVITVEHDYTNSIVTLDKFNLKPNKLEDIRDEIINFN